MAKQQSRVGRLWSGDHNTGFFHARAAMRQRQNMILTLEDSNGVILEKKEDVQEEIPNFYTSLYIA